MGWSSWYTDISKEEIFRQEARTWGNEALQYRLLGQKLVGSQGWSAFEVVENGEAKYRFLHLTQIKKTRGGQVLVRHDAEDVGPYFYDVPASIWDLVEGFPGPDSEFSRQWREDVRAKKALGKPRIPKAGDRVKVSYFNQDSVFIIYNWKQHYLKEESTGRVFRFVGIKKEHLSFLD